jgi:hypothetical protein
MFLVNELVLDDKTRKQITKSELNARDLFEVLEMKTNNPTAEFWTVLTTEKIRHRDALHLSACHLEWLTKRNLAAYQELLAALDDHDDGIRRLAESLLRRSSPRPQRTATSIESC